MKPTGKSPKIKHSELESMLEGNKYGREIKQNWVRGIKIAGEDW